MCPFTTKNLVFFVTFATFVVDIFVGSKFT